MGVGVVGLVLQRLSEIVNGFFRSPLKGQDAAKVVAGFRKAGFDLQGLSVIRRGLFEIPLPTQDVAQAGVGLGVVGCDLQRRPELGHGVGGAGPCSANTRPRLKWGSA